jgi:hypothetical protein
MAYKLKRGWAVALDLDPEVTEGRRPVFMAVFGLLLIAGGGFLLYTDLGQPAIDTQPTVPDTYHYAISQSANANVHYLQSSFFNNGPSLDDHAYVTDLTNSIGARFHYHYKANKAQTLTYSHSVNALVKTTYGSGDSSRAASNVWSKNYVLVPSKVVTETTDTITLDPTVDVPFASYKKATDAFKLAYSLPVSSEMDVIATFHVSGSVNGRPVSDDEVQSVSAPLDSTVYKLSVKFDRSVSKDIAPAAASKGWNMRDHYAEVAASVLLLFGFVSLIYGLRRQIFKSPYQRELDHIYRYYDGIVIRANKPTDMEGKNVVSVASFDDMLNLEEEMKLPIVASPAGSEAMHFMIMKDNDVYIYTLGKVVLDSDSVDEVEESLSDKPVTPHKKSVRKVKVR